MSERERRILHKIVINELSSVDRPAQEGAQALLLKRDDSDEDSAPDTDIVKFDSDGAIAVLLTDSINGHAHGISVHENMLGGDTSYNAGTGDEVGHSHPWAMDASGEVRIGETNGHTHKVDFSSLSQLLISRGIGKVSDPDTTPNKESDMDENEKVAELEIALKRANDISSLNDIQKSHFEGLEDSAQGAFLELSGDDRDAEIAKLSDADAIVYTADNGDEFRKSDDSRLVTMAKERDAERKELALAKATQANADLEKRAEATLGNLPGELPVRAAIVKALDTILDEDIRKAAFEAVAAGNKAISAAFGSAGHSDSSVQSNAEDELDRLAKARASEKGLDYYTAYEEISSENAPLVKRAINGGESA